VDKAENLFTEAEEQNM